MVNKKWFFIGGIIIALGAGVIFWSLSQQEKAENNNNDKIEQMVVLGKQWFTNNVRDDGAFNYLYNEDATLSDQDNIVRQLLAFRVIAKLCKEGDKSLCKIHQDNLDFIFNTTYRTDIRDGQKMGHIYYRDMAKLGASALTLRVLVESPYYNKYEKESWEIFKGIKYLQKEDGSLDPFLTELKYTVDDDYALTFYSGETTLALIEYYEKVGKDEVYDVAKKSQDYYLDKYVKDINYNYYPAYVPWHTLSLLKFYKKTQDRKYADAVFILNDELLKIQDKQDVVGRFYDWHRPEYGKPHSSSDGIYAESLVAAYQLALELDDKKHQAWYGEAVGLALDNLISLQFCNENNSLKTVEEKLCGGMKARRESLFSRVDSLAHTFEFLFALQEVMAQEERGKDNNYE